MDISKLNDDQKDILNKVLQMFHRMQYILLIETTKTINNSKEIDK